MPLILFTMSKSSGDDLSELQAQWKDMFQKKLPDAATSKSSAQPKWSVHVDHCFARIILDQVVGNGTEPWMASLKSPAYKNMTREQLEQAITLGDDILDGRADLVELDEKSLAVRGKASRNKSDGNKNVKEEPKKTKGSLKEFIYDKEHNSKKDADITNKAESASRKRSHTPETTNETPSKARKVSSSKTPKASQTPEEEQNPNTAALQTKINNSSKTTFQKSVLSLILQIPRGKYTTYGQISTHLSSSPRAVGNALRNNPFAPEVPCHRILASGGGLGGFKGSWGKNGEEGKNDAEKRRLLRAEGVKFSGDGKVVGSPWGNFK